MTPRWLNVAQAAEYTGYSTDTIGDALRSGALVGHQPKPGAHWRIAAEACDAWIKGEAFEPHIPSVTRRRAS